MATGRLSAVLQHVRGDPRPDAVVTDGELLKGFLARRDEAAFEALVRRHGPMVMGVCRRVLGDHHDAEDAFQATFLVLAMRAAAIGSPELLANWLYGVAHNVALRARAAADRRHARERQVAEMPEPAVASEPQWADLRRVLDEELRRLPERYRVAIVLCDLEGRTRREAAELLGCPDGTVAARLARGRALLARRLARRGLALSAALLTSLLSSTATATVRTKLIDAVVRAAPTAAAGGVIAGVSAEVVATAEGVTRAMTLNKIKTTTVFLVATAIVGAAVAASVLAAGSPAGSGTPATADSPKAPTPPLAAAPAPGAPDGRWGVEFANGVTQVCEIRKDGTASAVELALPKYPGNVVRNDGAVLVEYAGDRTQRFTPVGERMVVEHWWPGAKKGTDRPVLGIAERVPNGTPGTLRYTDATRGFSLNVPDDWTLVPPGREFTPILLSINNRGDRVLRVTRSLLERENAAPLRLEPGTVYIELARFPELPSEIRDSVGSDLAPLLKDPKQNRIEDGKLSTLALSFTKLQRHWTVQVYFREPVADDVRAKALDVLRSVEFIEPQDPKATKDALPSGRWVVEVAKGAPGLQREVRADGTFSVLPADPDAPVAREGGKASVKDGSVVFTFDAGPVERWTPVGTRFVVESWPDGSKFPAAAPSALGIAERPAAVQHPRGGAAEPGTPPREEPGETQAAAIAALKKLGGEVTPDRVSFRRATVTDADLIHLKALPGVTLVWFVGSTKVTDAGLEHFKGMKNLESAYLVNTGVGDAGLAHLKGLANLKNLYLSGTKVGDPGLKQLKEMDSLRVLYLDELKITDDGLDHLKGMDKLVALSLNATKVTDAGLKKLAGLTRLGHLHLNDTGVTDDGLAHLKALGNLRHLDLKGTKVTDDGVKRLKEALPNCQIVHQK